MPELPEVETMRRGIAAIVGSVITAAGRTPCLRKPILVQPAPKRLQQRVLGQKVLGVERIGKRVVIQLESGDALIFEPRMTGLVLVADPPTTEHLRFRLEFSGGPISQVWYWDRRGLGSVRLLSSQQLTRRLRGDALGPDALILTADDLQQRLARSRRAIKAALLDQRAVAGVGNLYASEILHLAKIHPAKRCDLLKPDQWREIHARMREVLLLAIQHEGSTLSDGTYRNALNQSGGYQNLHRVYDRAGQRCQQCAAAGRESLIQRIVQTQRATFFCSRCQTKRKIRE